MLGVRGALNIVNFFVKVGERRSNGFCKVRQKGGKKREKREETRKRGEKKGKKKEKKKKNTNIVVYCF